VYIATKSILPTLSCQWTCIVEPAYRHDKTRKDKTIIYIILIQYISLISKGR